MDIFKKNLIFRGTAEGFSSDGSGVFRHEGRAVFVKGAIPGEEWLVRVTKVASSAVWGRGEELLSPSPHRLEPACPHFGVCGGCDLMHMDYGTELSFKLRRVNDALRRIGGLDLEASEILGADSVYAYRNKAVFAVAGSAETPLTGFYRPRSHELIPVASCLIQSDAACRCAEALRQWMRLRSVSPYDGAKGGGLIRNLFVRTSRLTGGVQACVVLSGGLGADTSSLAPALREGCPELESVVLCVNKSPGNSVLNGSFHTLWGADTIADSLCGLSFRLSPASFFQINPPQTEKLYSLAREYAGTGKLALDLYCGAGTISLCLAPSFGRVIGAEIVPEAVSDARENAARNGIENAEFILADAGEAALMLASRGLRPDVITLDPPRKGLSPEVIGAVVSMSPERVVYVSCDPGTLARDLKAFAASGYTPASARAVDMFPRTRHVETIVLLQREIS